MYLKNLFKGFLLLISMVGLLSFFPNPNNKMEVNVKSNTEQKFSNPTANISSQAFTSAIKGWQQLGGLNAFKNKHIVIIDFTKPSTEKRLFIYDAIDQKIIHESLVAHGKNSGELYANSFSNISGSHQSSLGFYKTLNTYTGKHGMSLRLEGLEKSNNQAFDRAIVIHSASYVSQNFILKNGRLGRSHGCPALPEKDYEKVIEWIKEGACIFIYHSQSEYLSQSEVLNPNSI